MTTIGVKLLDPLAKTPTHGSEHAAGYDLHSCEGSINLPPGARRLIRTGLAVAIPDGFVGMIRPRSGLAVKNGIDVLAGVVDSDYRGEVGVALINHGTSPFRIEAGDRIAQLVLQRHEYVDFREWPELPPTLRDAGGFGSTGTAALKREAAKHEPRPVHNALIDPVVELMESIAAGLPEAIRRAKAEAWDEGFRHGYVGDLDNPVSNPYDDDLGEVESISRAG